VIARLPRVAWSVIDDSGTISATRIAIRAGSTAAAGFAAASAYRPLAAAISGADCVEQRVIFSLVPDVRPVPAPGVPIGDCAVFVFATTDPAQWGIVEVVGFDRSLLESTGPGAGVRVDLAAPAVIAFCDELVSGAYCNPFGYILTGVESGFLTVRA
jgi:hypothetical protein